MLKKFKVFFLFAMLWAQLANIVAGLIGLLYPSLIWLLTVSVIISSFCFLVFLILNICIKIRKFYRIDHPKNKNETNR